MSASVLYTPGNPDPQLLLEVRTPGIVTDALSSCRAPRRNRPARKSARAHCITRTRALILHWSGLRTSRRQEFCRI
jgi:hypothetical protein